MGSGSRRAAAPALWKRPWRTRTLFGAAPPAGANPVYGTGMVSPRGAPGVFDPMPPNLQGEQRDCFRRSELAT
jgi:hypothetical protein